MRHALGSMGYFTLLGWSPDERRIAFQDNHLHLYAIDLGNDAVSLIDTSPRRNSFSPGILERRPMARLHREGENYFTQVKLHSFASGRSSELADHFIQTDNPVFGGNEYLYFTASIDAGPTRVWLDMSTQERPLRTAIYAAVLAADGHSPLPPKSGDEEPKGGKDKDCRTSNEGYRPEIEEGRRMTKRINRSSPPDRLRGALAALRADSGGRAPL